MLMKVVKVCFSQDRVVEMTELKILRENGKFLGFLFEQFVKKKTIV